MVSKQAVRHSDLAIDRQWNVDEQGAQAVALLSTVAKTGVQIDAFVVALAEAIRKGKD